VAFVWLGSIDATCTWQSMNPGNTVEPERSMTCAPDGVVKPFSTATILSSRIVIETFCRGAAETPSISVPAWMTVSALRAFWARTRAVSPAREYFNCNAAVKIGAGSITAIISGHGTAFDIEGTRGAAYRGSLGYFRRRMLARPGPIADFCRGEREPVALAGGELSLSAGVQGPDDLLLGG